MLGIFVSLKFGFISGERVKWISSGSLLEDFHTFKVREHVVNSLQGPLSTFRSEFELYRFE